MIYKDKEGNALKVLSYIQKYGIRHMINVVYRYKIDIIIQMFLGLYLRDKPLKKIIMIESHNDFDSNGGAFYDYLIKNGYNKKYKIVWLIKHPESVPKELPENVEWVCEYKPGFRKNYYKWMAGWFSADQDCFGKLKDEQKTIYLSHGSIALKDCAGMMVLPDNLDYYLTASEYMAPIDARQYNWKYPNKEQKICGFPSHDFFYSDEPGDLSKVLIKNDKKVILWMPTFRKSIGNRNDSAIQQKLGIPLIDSYHDYEKLNDYLQKRNLVLILKIHPKQDLTILKVKDLSNIKVLTGESVKLKGINANRLMKDVDGLISDYSSAAYDFLHVNRPIAYDLSDLDSYLRGIVVKDPHEMMAGHEIRNLSDMYAFIDDIADGKDPYYLKRQELFDRLFKYHDGDSSKRIAELLGL